VRNKKSSKFKYIIKWFVPLNSEKRSLFITDLKGNDIDTLKHTIEKLLETQLGITI
jgi:hypothetical protein